MPADAPGHKGARRQGLALLALILALGAALRLWGLRWGLPDPTHLFSYHPDEYHSLRGALSLAVGDPNPHFFNYGSLYLYLVALACLWHDATFGGADLITALLKGDSAHVQMAAWVLDARLVTVACSLATVLVAWFIGRRLFGLRGAAVASALMAVLPLHVLHSHYATVDVPQTLFIALTLYFALRVLERPSWRNCLLSGAAAGLAASVKYNGAVALVAPVVALGMAAWVALGPQNVEGMAGGSRGGAFRLSDLWRRERRWQRPKRRKWRWPWGQQGAWRSPQSVGRRRRELVRLGGRLAGMLAAAALAFALTSPYVLLSWPEARQDIRFELEHMRVGEWPVRQAYPSGLKFHLHASLLVVALALVLSPPARRRRLVPAAAFGALWFVMIANAGVRYARYEMPLEALTALGAAGLAAALWGIQRSGVRWAGLVLLALWGLALAAITYQRDGVLARIDVRAEMLAKVRQLVPEGETLGLMWEPWFNVAPVDYCNGGDVLRHNPLFARFRRPVRPLVVTGVDADRLRREKPYAVLISNFELDPAFPPVSPICAAVLKLLHDQREYQQAAYSGTAFLVDHPAQCLSASDSRYPTPWLELYIRKADTARARTTDGSSR